MILHNQNHHHHHRTWHHHLHHHHRQTPSSNSPRSQLKPSAPPRQQTHLASATSDPPRRPAPEQPAPQRPASMAAPQSHHQLPSYTTASSAATPNRASTLNRLDLLKRRQQQAASNSPTTVALRRNLSSLGHYTASPAVRPDLSSASSSTPTPVQPQTNGYAYGRTSSLGQQRPPPPARDHHHQIYSPASIASPREFANYSTIVGRQPAVIPKTIDSSEQHYASTSVKSHHLSHLPVKQHYQQQQQQPSNQASFSQRQETPRPESALGQLLSRFGTFRRKARRHLTGRSWSRNRSQTPHSQIYAPASIAGFSMTTGSGSPITAGGSSKRISPAVGPANIPPVPPSQPLVLDPEIYASGRRQVVADEIYAEGSRALDSNAERRLPEHDLDPALMAEGETRTIIEEQSQQRPDYRLLVRQLTNWLNDELAEQRIIVRDLQEDLYDGQVLCKLIEKLQRIKLDIVEVTQNELAQKQKIGIVLDTLNKRFASQARSRARVSWSVEGIHSKNPVEILQLLVAMALHYRAPLRLPANVIVQVLVFQKHHDELVRRSHQVQLTDEFVADSPDRLKAAPLVATTLAVSDASSQRRDAFDTLLECAPEKLHVVKRSLANFCNRHLNKVNMSCGQGDDLKPENFSDGLLLVFLISSLEDYFVPLGNLFTTATTTTTTITTPLGLTVSDKANDITHHGGSSIHQPHELPFIDANNNNPAELDAYAVGGIEQPTALEPTSYTCSQPIEKLHNVNVALQLIQEAGLADIRQRVRPEEIVNGDLKAVLRVLYAIFGRYKHL